MSIAFKEGFESLCLQSINYKQMLNCAHTDHNLFRLENNCCWDITKKTNYEKYITVDTR